MTRDSVVTKFSRGASLVEIGVTHRGDLLGALCAVVSCGLSCEASRKDTLLGVRLLLGDVGFLELVALGAGSVVGDDPVRRLFLNLDPIVPFSPLPWSSY